jgi:FkbM family methyltransferase
MSAKTQLRLFEYEGVEFEVILPEGEQIISQQLMKTRCWEQNQLNLYPFLAKDAESPFTVVDIGANVGVNSIYLSKRVPNSVVYSLEPHPVNFELLELNVFNAKASVKTRQVAISNFSGVINFSVAGGTNAHIVNEKSSDSLVVDCVTLDSFVESEGIASLDLLKIDVEGFTDLVLEGATKSLGLATSCIVEISYGDLASRNSISIDKNLREPQQSIIDLAAAQINQIQKYFKHIYLISRGFPLVKLDNPDEFLDLMFLEATVGDILATNIDGLISITPTQMISRFTHKLMQENGLRIRDILSLRQV